MWGRRGADSWGTGSVGGVLGEEWAAGNLVCPSVCQLHCHCVPLSLKSGLRVNTHRFILDSQVRIEYTDSNSRVRVGTATLSLTPERWDRGGGGVWDPGKEAQTGLLLEGLGCLAPVTEAGGLGKVALGSQWVSMRP